MRTAPFELRGGHVLAALLLFFLMIVAVNIGFAIAAVRTFPGEDERRSYTQGLRYNDILAERRAQAAIGWRAQTDLRATPTGARLIVILKDRQGAPINGAAIEGVLRWPANEDGDRALSFLSVGDGRYTAELEPLTAGRWDLRARATDASGRSLDFEAELTWPSTR